MTPFGKNKREEYLDAHAAGLAAGYIKIHVTLDAKTAGVAGESLWALPVTPTTAQIKNLPFFATGYTIDDIVEHDQTGEVIRLVTPAPHGQVSIILYGETTSVEVHDLIRWGHKLGMRFERGAERLFVATVPPAVFGEVYAALMENPLIECLETMREPAPVTQH